MTYTPREPPGDALVDAAEMLWVVLANVGGGDWTQQSAEWREAAARWRDNYFSALKAQQTPTGDARRLLVEKLALKYHKADRPDGEGEYGCPGVECPGVKRLTAFAERCVEAALSPEAQSSNDLDKGLIARTMEALESGATTEQRERAWNQLRERYFPVLSPEAHNSEPTQAPVEAIGVEGEQTSGRVKPAITASAGSEALSPEAAVPSAPAGLRARAEALLAKTTQPELWHACEEEDDGRPLVCLFADDEHAGPVIWRDGMKAVTLTEADAEFIAAAPQLVRDLLAALQSAEDTP